MTKETDERPKQEIERRMQNAIQRALRTPPKPFTKPAKGKPKKKDQKARRSTADRCD